MASSALSAGLRTTIGSPSPGSQVPVKMRPSKAEVSRRVTGLSSFCAPAAGVAGMRANELANAIVPGLGWVLAGLLLVGGVVFNIGNVAGAGIGTEALAGIDPRWGAALSAVLAIGIFLSRWAGWAMDRVVVVLGALMLAGLVFLMGGGPPVAERIGLPTFYFLNRQALYLAPTILLIVAAVGALTLTHRQRIRARLSQRAVAAGKMQDYAAKGAHPGQKPMPGVYASTNSAAAPALDAQGEAVEESVPRVLRARGQGLELSDVSPEMGLAQRSGTIVSRLAGASENGQAGGPRDARRSGMPSMPGAAAPTVKQPVLSDDGAADSAAPEQKEEK